MKFFLLKKRIAKRGEYLKLTLHSLQVQHHVD
jgi:hypothetical protein